MENNKEFYTLRGYDLLQQDAGKLTPSMEDYLEMIYRCHFAEGYVRIGHLAEQLNVKASSASKVVQKLAQMGYLAYERYKLIQLTPKGLEWGEFLLRRHNTVETLLQNIGVEKTAHKDTEMIEHYLGMDTLEIIENFNEYLQLNPNIVEEVKKFNLARQKTDGPSLHPDCF